MRENSASAAVRDLFDGAASDPLSGGAMARIMAMDGFSAAAACSARGILETYQNRYALNRVLNDRGRLVLSLLLLDLHFRAESGEGELTLSRLQALCHGLDVCSPNRVAAMVAVMRLFGYVAVAPSADRRARRLVATEPFERITRERWSVLLEGASRLFPHVKEVLDRLQDRAVMAAFVRALSERFAGGYRTVHATPAIAPYIERDGGLLVLLALGSARTGSEGGAAEFTIAETARRLDLSRAHVASVLKMAAADGLVVRSGARDERVRPTDALAALTDRFLAAAFLIHAVAAWDCLHLLAAGQAGTSHTPGGAGTEAQQPAAPELQRATSA
ncbi:hypothetical protein ACUN0C_05550 [Faunimonas sp. B44]|uniref:hypothetical protein n=1 Tax=Faunimonas sp. B44 TaxID=3461493 RepID=UPI004043ED8E